jgi:two-component system, LuxR family, sensor kinase FixL
MTERSVLALYAERGNLPAIEAIAENSRIPKDAQVRPRPPGLWQTHRTFVLFAAGTILLQAALIAVLAAERIWRRRAEVWLRQSEERMSLAANAANLGMWLWDVPKDEVWMTDKGRALFGFTPGERVNYETLTARVHPDDRARREAAMKGALETLGQYAVEYRVVLPDGNLRWIGARGHCTNGRGSKGTRLLGVSIDVTAQKQAEEALRESEARFRLVVEASPNGIVLVGSKANILLANPEAEKLFGYEREELIGQPVEVLVPERCRGGHLAQRRAVHPAPAAWAVNAGRDLFIRRKDGSEVPAEVGLSSIEGEHGTLVLAVIVDISPRKKAEADARQYREELAHLSRVEILGEMAASLAHELNQPLTGIMNNASAGRRFISKGRADLPKLDGLLEAVIADTRRAGQVIQGIRGMVRKGEVKRVPVNLNNIVADVMLFVRSEALERHCVLTTELDPKLPMVIANPVLLQQVLINIIVNAFDAMAETPIADRRVIIGTQRGLNGSMQVNVRDFGTGLPVENPQQIFQHFFSTKRHGLGVGLAIVRSIIASHGGELAAMNVEGGGACVCFSLPAISEGTA